MEIEVSSSDKQSRINELKKLRKRLKRFRYNLAFLIDKSTACGDGYYTEEDYKNVDRLISKIDGLINRSIIDDNDKSI